MSNHYSAADLRFPGDDARLDFTDIYAFQEPGDDVFSVPFAWLTNGKGQLRRPQTAR
jgi:hypothetical protein